MTDADVKAKINTLIEDLFDNLDSFIYHKDVPLGAVVRELRNEVGSEIADMYEEWVNDG